MKLFDREGFKNKKWVPYTIALCAAVTLYICFEHINLLFVGVQQLIRFTRPVLIGLVIAYVLNPLVKIVRKSILRKIRKDMVAWPISVAVTIILVIVLLVILLVALIPQFISSIVGFISNLNVYAETLNGLISRLDSTASDHNFDISGITNLGEMLIDEFTNLVAAGGGSGGIVTTVTGIGTAIANGIVSFIISIYFLLDKNHLKQGVGNLVKLLTNNKQYIEISDFWRRCNNILVRFIGFDLIDGVIIGCINAIFMVAAGMPYVVLISVVVGVTNLAPTFGPLVGAVIGSFILLFVNPWYVLWFVIFTICLQTFDGYILKPKMFGNTFGVPGIWILICIIVFGRMFGVAGILLAIPLAAIIDFIYRDYILGKLEVRKAEIDRKELEHKKASEKDSTPKEN